MSEPTNANAELEQLVEKLVDQLAEHFDGGVQILCCRMNGKETERCFRGSGNIYARHGMARDYLIYADAIERHYANEDIQKEDSY